MDAKQTKMLPRPSSNPHADAYVEITPFETGNMSTSCSTLVEDARGSSTATSWRFLLRHRKTGTNFWFDMGISSDLSVYPPAVQRVHAHFQPSPSSTSIEQDTRSLNIDPESIKHVIISHGHWDHLHPLPPAFTKSNMIVGAGSSAHCSPGFPKAPDSKFDGRIWDPELRSFPVEELPPPASSPAWKPLGPFPHAYDFFDDGSFYLIDAPGHMQGNLAALARVKTKKGQWKWVLLGGDCAHCNLFTYWPDAPFGKMPKALFPSGCLHESAETARRTIERIAECKRNEGNDLLVSYAHSDFLEGFWEL
ncbi:metallo-beta-lactamase superfamily protein [Cadophora sp. MPI-SDFR-AT-0126]|nr:metallo-beta-lactamase superfamily protein [Leotiomycetes sp. MPI-SDFR-AT-0126]